MDTLLSETISASEWCEQIIKKQENVTYSSLTNPKDLNHVVKAAIQQIINYLKSQGLSDMTDVNVSYPKLKEALKILTTYTLKHTVWKPSRSKPLTEKELEEAFNDLYIDKYVKADRKFNDPDIRGQNYALFSFTPSNSAQPDSDGIYGFIKVRGAFKRLEAAEEKAKELIQYFSANQIFVCEIGTPTPLQSKLKDLVNVQEVDHPDKEEVVKFTDLVKEQTMKEKQQMEEIREREEKLREDVTKNKEEKPLIQVYLELIHKRATCAYLYTKYQEKIKETEDLIVATREQIAKMDEEHPNLKDEYMEHYTKTSAETGIDKATDDMAVMIKQFVGKDTKLGFEDK